jgi:hypothetical protein
LKPLFVLGLARSGTNLLARMLDRHPHAVVALDPLMPVFRSLRNAVLDAAQRRFDPQAPFQDFYFSSEAVACLDALLDGDASLPAGDLAALRTAVEQRAALESPELGRLLHGLQGTTYRGLIEGALGIIASTKPGAEWVGCKEVWIFDFVPLLARAFPDARFYAIERDPRGILASLLKMAERDATQAAHPPSYMRHWRKSVALARRFEADPQLRRRFRALAYEQLVADPAAEAGRICTELGLDYIPDMLSLSAEGWSGNSSYAHGKDVYASSAARWKQSLPADVRQAADYLCGPEMALTRYRPDTDATPAGVEAYLQHAESAPASWRSTSGNPAEDFAGERRRYELLKAGQGDANEIRRCFLFPETFKAITQAG